MKLTAEIIAWNQPDQLIDCICGTGMMKGDSASLTEHAKTFYGGEWIIDNPIKLTMDTPQHII